MREVLSGIISNPVWLGRDSRLFQHPENQTGFYQPPVNQTAVPDQRNFDPASLQRLVMQRGAPQLQARGGGCLTLDPRIISNTVPFIISQYMRVLKLMAFRSTPSYLTDGLTLRLRTSNIIYSTMFLGAKVFQALLDNFDQTDWRIFAQRIDQFHRQIDMGDNDDSNMEDRVTVIMDLASFKWMTADSASGYALMKRAAPLFYRAALSYPDIWAAPGVISLPHAISLWDHELARFVWVDNLAALLFGTEPFFPYHTASGYVHVSSRDLGWVYGCPEESMILLGQITSLRSSVRGPCMVSATVLSELDAKIREWSPSVDNSTESCVMIAHLAVHECWRRALLIYMYMASVLLMGQFVGPYTALFQALYKANTGDHRVVSSVQQIIQLLGIVKHEDFTDRHLFFPCLIAGISARKESHRGLIWKRVAALSATKIWILQGSDFTSVLDHLWHSAGRAGRLVVWEDYVASRRAVLPVDESPLRF